MAEEIEDSAFFREDCSTESDWEVFHAQLRELFQEFDLSCDWGRELENNELFRCEWNVRCEKLELFKKKFLVQYYTAVLDEKTAALSEPVTPDVQAKPTHTDLMSFTNTFGTTFDRHTLGNLHPLARYYGLRRFVVIHPEVQYFTNPAEFSFFLSGAIVAATETCSNVPIFVQIFDPKWNYFLGVGVSNMLRTNFDVVAIEQAPVNWLYLAGLLGIFHEKIGETYTKPVMVSVRMTYKSQTKVRIPGHIPFSKSLGTNENSPETSILSTSQFTALPHGFLPDSLTDLYVSYTWPQIAENIAIDSEFTSDFTPLNAAFGNIYLKTHATSYLSSCLMDYLKLRGNTQSLESFVGKNFSGQSSATESPNPLDKLTEHKLTLRTFRDGRGKRSEIRKQPRKIPGPMNEFELEQMLLYLFPDIQPDGALWPYEKHLSKQEFDPQRIKSASPDSLIMRLSCLLANCNAHFGSAAGLSQLWAAFIKELRLLWDNGLKVPGISAGFPDTRTCLLHQKLQMLNVCVERRRQREFGIKAEVHASRIVKREIEREVEQDMSASARDGAGAGAGDNDNDESTSSHDNDANDGDVGDDNNDDDCEEDEFYDCDEESANLNRPEGRLKRLGDLKLLDSDEFIYVPVTQEIVLKTEDQLYEDAEVMLKSGPGSGLTTQMMCSSLLSDMEAFKAANPVAKMEDFIRWYSPKDWEEETDELGNTTHKLSPRMTAQDNTWQSVWNQAQPVPVWKQKRLFDETHEALQVLQYLETRTIGEIYELTIITVLHSAILKLKDILNQCQVLDIFSVKIDTLLTELCRLSRDVEVINETETSTITQLPNSTPIIKQLEALETQLYQYKCFELMADYPNRTEFNDIKCKFKEALENGGSCKMAIHKQVETSAGDASIGNAFGIFGSQRGDLKLNLRHELHDNLISKEYVIRTDNETHANKEQSGPQFLRAIITGESLRLCGAFTENTTFV